MNENTSARQSPQEHNNENRQVARRESIVVASQFSGPLPPPEILAKYNQIVPGAADRIITMAEEQSRHRRDLESRVISSDIITSKQGRVSGVIVALAALGVAAFMTARGQSLTGLTLSLSALASLVGVFIYGSQRRRSEREQRRQEEKR